MPARSCERRERRQLALGMSQERLAAASGVDLSQLNRIEGGKRTGSPATVAKLCRGLGLSADEATVLHMAGRWIPTGIDGNRLRAALALVQVATMEEVEAAYRLIVAARDEGLRQLAAGK